MAGLIQKGVFKEVIRDEVPDVASGLGDRFFVAIKEINTNENTFKAIFVV